MPVACILEFEISELVNSGFGVVRENFGYFMFQSTALGVELLGFGTVGFYAATTGVRNIFRLERDSFFVF